jgi:putative SOS response-associated peptidase YedK
MCGRYSNLTPPEAMRRIYRTVVGLPNCPPGYNCAPTQSLPVVRRGTPGRELVLMRWGLVPAWSRGPEQLKASTINARAETVAEKPAFRAAFRARRCLVPADGFYEWKTEGKRKRPYRFTLKDGRPFALAGLWERWRGTDGLSLESFAIIATTANAVVAPVHNRMPVILPEEAWEAWLDPDNPSPADLLLPLAAEEMTATEVSSRVNSPRNNDAGCLKAESDLFGPRD